MAAPSLAARARFQRAAQQDQRDDGRRGFVVDLVAAAQRLPQRVEKRRAGAQRDQRVHVGRAVAQRAPRRRVERRAGVEHHRQRERQLHPRRSGATCPAPSPARRRPRPPASAAGSAGSARRAGSRLGHAVAQVLDGGDEIARPARGRGRTPRWRCWWPGSRGRAPPRPCWRACARWCARRPRRSFRRPEDRRVRAPPTLMPALRSPAARTAPASVFGLHHVRVVFHRGAWRLADPPWLWSRRAWRPACRSTLRAQFPQVMPRTEIFRDSGPYLYDAT